MVVERKEAWLIWRQRNTEVGGGEFVVFFGPVVVGFGRDKEDSFLFFLFFILVMFKIARKVIFKKYFLFKNILKLLHMYDIVVNILPDQDSCSDRWNG
jgi:hypothetical protein